MLPEGSRTHNRPKALHRSPSLSRGRPSDKTRFGGRRGGETGGQGLAETHRKHEPIPDVSQALRRFWSRHGTFWNARSAHFAHRPRPRTPTTVSKRDPEVTL